MTSFFISVCKDSLFNLFILYKIIYNFAKIISKDSGIIQKFFQHFEYPMYQWKICKIDLTDEAIKKFYASCVIYS
jgi:hypothetical protein